MDKVQLSLRLGFLSFLIVVSIQLSGVKGNRDLFFSDISDSIGLIGTGNGRGICYGDFDRDMDIDICYFGDRVYLFSNNEDGSFSEVADEAGIGRTHQPFGGGFGDYDNDGFLDLLVLSPDMGIPSMEDWPWVSRPFTLYRSNGDGTFTNATREAGFPTRPGYATASVFFDYDNDGFLDLYLAGQGPVPWHGRFAYSGRQDLYRNNGDGTFTNVTVEVGLGYPGYDRLFDDFVRSVSVGDVDGNGYLDILTMSEEEDLWRLYTNNGNQSFSAINTNGSLGFPSIPKWKEEPFFSGGFADFNNDGHLDIFLNNGKYIDNPGRNKLYLNNGNTTFQDITQKAGIENPEQSGRAVAFGDFDNDGFIDIYLTGWDCWGHPSQYPARNILYRNNGDLTFTDITDKVGLTRKGRDDWSATALDFDDDGFLDLCINGDYSRERILYHSSGNDNHWLDVELIGIMSNRDAVGAFICAISGNLTQVRELGGGGGALCQEVGRIHLGLGTHTVVDRLKVEWPSGLVQIFEGLDVDRTVIIREGVGGEISWKQSYVGPGNIPIDASFSPMIVLADAMDETILTVRAFPVPGVGGGVSKVIADLSSIGGLRNVIIADDGTGGDEVAGDGIYTLRIMIHAGAPDGYHTVPILLEDLSGRTRHSFATLDILPSSHAFIFSDSMNSPWIMSKKSGRVELESSNAYSGNACHNISLKPGGWTKYQAQKPYKTHGFEKILFSLKPLNLDPEKLILHVKSIKGEVALTFESLGIQPQIDGWSQISIPLANLNLDNTEMVFLRFFARDNTSFLLDEVALSSPIREYFWIGLILLLPLFSKLSNNPVMRSRFP